MGKLDNLIAKLEAARANVTNGLWVREALQGEGEEEILRLQKEQLASGLRADEGSIVPQMNYDPYFKGSIKGARRYADYKQKVFAGTEFESKRDYWTPNLNLGKGVFWDSLAVEFRDEGLLIVTKDTPLGPRGDSTRDVYKKFDNGTFGLTPVNMAIISANYVTPYIQQKLKSI